MLSKKSIKNKIPLILVCLGYTRKVTGLSATKTKISAQQLVYE